MVSGPDLELYLSAVYNWIFFGKPSEEAQIYDSNTYIREYTYLGITEEIKDGMVKIEQRNKFSVGETIEIMKPNGDNVEVQVKRIVNEEGEEQESAPHPKQVLYVELSGRADKYDILREKRKQMMKKTWKPYAAIVLILLYGVDIFWLSGFCVYYFGEWGIPMYEGLLAVLALVIVVLFREDVKRAFPFHRPTIAKTVGTLLMWIGTLLITMIPTSILLYVFPEQMSGATESVSELSGGLPFGLAFLLICVTPAIFEEIAFRGGLFSCFRGFRSPWPAILISAAVFGAFHGSFWRFVPTAMLGIAMGYLLAETDNMFYNMFFHLINNALPTLLLQLTSSVASEQMESAEAMASTGILLVTVAVYFIYASAGPFLLYAGNYLIHKGQPGYDRGLLPREKKKTLLGLVLVSSVFLGLGILLFGIGMFE